MIAAPVKTNKTPCVVSPLFGKAKYFAFKDRDGETKILKNDFEGGMKVANWLLSNGVTKLIVAHMGQNPFGRLRALGIKVYFCGNERVLFDDAILKMADGDLPEVTFENYEELFADHDHSHEHSHEHSGGNCCSSTKSNHSNLTPKNQEISKNINFSS